MNSVCMLYQNKHAHPAHQAFGEAVNADLRHFETGQPPPAGAQPNRIARRIQTGLSLTHYDTVIAEGTAPLQTLMSYKAKHPSTTGIYLAADETFYTLPNRPTHYIWRFIGPIVNVLLDGVIAVGKDVYRWAQRYIGDVPVKYVYPPISDKKYESLVALEASSPQEPFTILSAGVVKPANGYGRLIDAVERLDRDKKSSVRAVILGEGHQDQEYGNSDVVETPGFVDLDEFENWFSQASIYVQSSVGDAFPVASLEGILSGTPTLVTTGVGVRELLPDEQIVAPSADGLYGGIEWLFETDPTRRTELGANQRYLVEGITETAQKDQFSTAIQSFS